MYFANIFKLFFKVFFIPSNNQTLIKYFKKFFRNICKVETCLLSLSCNQLQTLNDNIMTTQELVNKANSVIKNASFTKVVKTKRIADSMLVVTFNGFGIYMAFNTPSVYVIFPNGDSYRFA